MKDVVAKLRYESQGKRLKLPSWCNSLIKIGMQFAQMPLAQHRSVFALAVPTRRYASVFLALGAVLGASKRSQFSDEYIRFIASQAKGTPVIYQRADKRLRGRIEGFYVENNKQYITIETGKRERRSYPLQEYATNITIAQREFKLGDYQKGGKVAEPGDFLSACVDDAASYIARTQLGCVIVGRISRLRADATANILRVDVGDSYFTGSPQEILRIRQFLGATHPYRCEVVASTSDVDRSVLSESGVPSLVVFDGSDAYLRHNHQWMVAHQIVVLDRTERTFVDAVASINQNYASRLEDQRIDLDVEIPDGAEAILFQEAACSIS